jgi:hypothetical protein
VFMGGPIELNLSNGLSPLLPDVLFEHPQLKLGYSSPQSRQKRAPTDSRWPATHQAASANAASPVMSHLVCVLAGVAIGIGCAQYFMRQPNNRFY